MAEPSQFRAAAAQTTRDVVLIRPRDFGVNPQTAASNAFQADVAAGSCLAARAALEVDALADRLTDVGVNPLVFDDTPEPQTPDALFPNNWVSFHADGSVVLYPMYAPNRRAERRTDILAALVEAGFQIREIIDLSSLEVSGQALEGTGSLVLDRPAGRAYAALSPRTSPAALQEFARRTGYQVQAFHTEHAGTAVYHTNVMLALGRQFAVVCDAAVREPAERRALLAALAASGRELIRIEPGQMENFAANLLELDTARGPLIAMSTRASEALTAGQRRRLEAFGRLLHMPLPAVEAGGGSLRCLLAEVFLPRGGAGGG